MSALARRMFELVEPIGLIPYSADEPNEAMFALGFSDYWDIYFAGRAAPLGSSVPAGVVHALFYNFAPGEVARHIPKVWSTTTPEAAIAARQEGCVNALRRILGDRVESADFTRAVELLTTAATSAPLEGRPMYAALRVLPLPEEPVARLFHAASLLREHRGDGHICALMAEGIGGLEAHVLLALDLGIPAPAFGRIHHLRRYEAQGRRPSGEVGVPVVREPQGEHGRVGFVRRVRDGPDRLDEVEHLAGQLTHGWSSVPRSGSRVSTARTCRSHRSAR